MNISRALVCLTAVIFTFAGGSVLAEARSKKCPVPPAHPDKEVVRDFIVTLEETDAEPGIDCEEAIRIVCGAFPCPAPMRVSLYMGRDFQRRGVNDRLVWYLEADADVRGQKEEVLVIDAMTGEKLFDGAYR